jgi:hypothetical protein
LVKTHIDRTWSNAEDENISLANGPQVTKLTEQAHDIATVKEAGLSIDALQVTNTRGDKVHHSISARSPIPPSSLRGLPKE